MQKPLRHASSYICRTTRVHKADWPATHNENFVFFHAQSNQISVERRMRQTLCANGAGLAAQ